MCLFAVGKGDSYLKKERLDQILDDNIEVFINNIAFELEKAHHTWFEDFGFPMFGKISEKYHEQVFFQSYLESYTRKMINGILKEIFDEEIGQDIVWPEFDFIGVYNGFNNIECEQKFGFEFINKDSKVGYRYCYLRNVDIEELLDKGGVNSINIILWENEAEGWEVEYEDSRIKEILLWDLFNELFFDIDKEEIRLMYDLFTKRIAKAVDQANSMISLTTLPGFTPSYLFKTRNKIITKMKKEIRLLSYYSVSNSVDEDIEKDSKWLIDKYQLSEYFLKNRYENAFVGISDFAKSYLTSEYLYCYFIGNPMFDYTPIVSGYLKSMEQLLHAICSSYLKENKKVLDISNYTMGKYIDFIQKERIFRSGFGKNKKIIIRLLNSYRAENRNNLFHKSYFSSWDKVEQIRKNTIFLYVVMLGAVDQRYIKEPAVLGMLNIEYDQLFCIVDGLENETFSFVLEGKEYSKMWKEPRDKGLEFNQNGLIINTIVFKKFDYDHYETIEISRLKYPTEIWTIDSFGKKQRNIWPLH